MSNDGYWFGVVPVLAGHRTPRSAGADRTVAGYSAPGSPDFKEGPRTIRSLSVDTLDELRHMVTLLRASGGRAVPR
ncbi:hypothetical protein ACFVZZ_28965 [Streptomyces chartreusis]|uniref:hypothetical protein n=1 Tax=Streptomyces chartreusis TaxID=1969 RepID=UPI0036DBCC1C